MIILADKIQFSTLLHCNCVYGKMLVRKKKESLLYHWLIHLFNSPFFFLQHKRGKKGNYPRSTIRPFNEVLYNIYSSLYLLCVHQKSTLSSQVHPYDRSRLYKLQTFCIFHLSKNFDVSNKLYPLPDFLTPLV